jgi:CheY-like chemotaxis protein
MAKGRILAIDDEPFFRQFYQDLLSKDGYLVTTAVGGREGMELLMAGEFDLVITDMEMPAMSGIETIEAIRKFNPEQEVIVVTGKSEVAQAIEVMKKGVLEYLLKPLSPDAFLLIVNRIFLRQGQRAESAKLMAENLEYYSILSAYQKCLVLLKVKDLDRLCDLILDTLMGLLEAEGGVFWLAANGSRELKRHASRGLANLPASEEVYPLDADLRRQFASGRTTLSGSGNAILAPLVADRELLGLLRVEMPSGRKTFNRRDLRVAEAVGAFAVAALQSVLFCRSLERGVLRVARGETYNMAFFRDHTEKELHKSRRYGRNVSLVKLVVENYDELVGRFLDREEAIQEVIHAILSVLRDADILAEESRDAYYMALPETDSWGALITQRRIRKAIQGRLVLSDLRKDMPIRVLMRSASCPNDGYAFAELEGVASRRLNSIRGSLFFGGRFEDLPFWSVAEQLLGSAADYQAAEGGVKVSPRLAPFERGVKGSYFRMAAERLEEITMALCHESIEQPQLRGIFYRGAGRFEPVRQTLQQVEGIEQGTTYFFLLGGGDQVEWDSQQIVPIPIADEHFAQMPFLIYLNEDQAYLFLARPMGKELIGFHSSDFYLVENMIAKLQDQYKLQARL